MIELLRDRLEKLRDSLHRRGERPSMVLSNAHSPEQLAEALLVVEEYGPLCEAMYLMMAVDKRVVDAERRVLRGALDVLSNGRVRTAHMEAMLDAAARRVAHDGPQASLARVMDLLRQDPARAEITVIMAAAIAAADHQIVPEETALLNEMFTQLGLDQERVDLLMVDALERSSATPEAPPAS